MRKLTIILSLIGLLCFSGAVVSNKLNKFRSSNFIETTTELPEKDLQLLATVISDVKKYYYKEVDNSSLFNKAISGMLASLDPHSAYLNLEELKELEMETLGKFGGIGVEVVPEQGAIKIISPLDDTPAYKAGIKAGDYIVQINGKLVRDMTLKDAVGHMRGTKGTKLKLTIIRKDESKPLVFDLKRETINIKTIKSRMLAPGYGYVRIALFQEPTEKDLVRSIKDLQKTSKNKLKGLILDMRNNPGGLFESAVQVADNFLDSTKLKDNDLIVYAKGQEDEEQLTAKATAGDILPNTPIVVLINEGSASASEIVAGALQDHKRAIVVGTKSFGKGSIQTLIPISKESAIKLTTALYYTPSGRSIQAKGIEPDIFVEYLTLDQKNQKNADIPRIDESSLMDHIKGGNKKTENTSEDRKKTEYELAYKDYQLYEALHILQSQNLINQ